MDKKEKIECVRHLTNLGVPLVRIAIGKASPKNAGVPTAKWRRIPCEKWKGIVLKDRPPESFHDCNVAVQTGYPLPDGRFLCIVDIDLKKKDGIDTWNRILEENGPVDFWAGPMSRTESGGIHLWFASKKQYNVALGLMPGIDFLGHGALSFEPPSQFTENGTLCVQYKWDHPPLSVVDIPDLPKWVTSELEIREIKALTFKASKEASDAMFQMGLSEYVMPFINECLSRYTPENGLEYDKWLRIGMSLHDATNGSEGAFTAFDNWGARVASEKNGEYDEKKTRITWDSFGVRKRDKVTYGSFVRMVCSDETVRGYIDSLIEGCNKLFSSVTVNGGSEVTSKNSDDPPAERGRVCEHLDMHLLQITVHNALLNPMIRINETNGATEITFKGEEMRKLDQAVESRIIFQCRDFGRKNRIKPLTKESDVMRAVNLIADKMKYHPIREYLNNCLEEYRRRKDRDLALFHIQGYDYPPDRIYRERMYAGINLVRGDDEQWFRHAVDHWLRGAVCKAFWGYQNPMLVLQGLQGTGKSTLARALAKKIGTQYYYAGAIDPNDKDHKIKLAQLFLWESDELSGTTMNADINKLKSLLTLTRINERPPYGRYVVDMDVVCSFMGTTNDATFLRDTTGSRRFLIAKFEPIDHMWTINWLRGIEFDPDMVWGEVYDELLRNGIRAPLLDTSDNQEAISRAEIVRQKDDLEIVLEDILEIQPRGSSDKATEWRLARKDLRLALDSAGIGMGKCVMRRSEEIISRLTGCKDVTDVMVQMNGLRYFRKVRLRSSLVLPPSMHTENPSEYN